MRRLRARPLSATLALLGAAVFFASTWLMAQRISAHNRTLPSAAYVVEPADATALHESGSAFEFAGRRVRLAEETQPDGSLVVVLNLDDDLVRLAVPEGETLLHASAPLLARHEGWLRLVLVRESRSTPIDQARIVIVARRPTLGADPRTGVHAKRRWAYDFHEVGADGQVHYHALRSTTTAPGEPTKPGEIQPGSWQEAVARLVTPALEGSTRSVATPPRRVFSADRVRAMGWTLPASCVSFLVMLIAGAFLAAPTRQS